jgi:hypothetical protein
MGECSPWALSRLTRLSKKSKFGIFAATQALKINGLCVPIVQVLGFFDSLNQGMQRRAADAEAILSIAEDERAKALFTAAVSRHASQARGSTRLSHNRYRHG